MTKKELIKKLKELQKDFDTEGAHCDADQALLDYIDDKKVAEAYNKINKWYA